MIDPGALDTRVALEEPVEVSDGGGGFDLTWTQRFTRWGALAMPTLRAQQEAIAAGALQSTTGGTLTVRDDSDTRTITAKWRAVVTTRANVATTWNIREVRPAVGDGYIRFSVEMGEAI